MLNLDEPEDVIDALRDMLAYGGKAHEAASEDNGRSGEIRNFLFGINTAIEAIIALIEVDIEE